MRLAAIEALGHVLPLMTPELFQSHLTKMLPTLLQLWRKENDKLPVTIVRACALARARAPSPSLSTVEGPGRARTITARSGDTAHTTQWGRGTD